MGETGKQLLLRRMNKSGGKFPAELRCFALTLHFYSSAAYNYIRATFGKNCLPHPKTLTKWMQSVDGSPGYNQEAIRAVKNRVSIEKEKGKILIAGLVMDEMAIKEHVEWNGSRQVGVINYGTQILDSDALPRAKNVLMFLLVATNSNWKVPIAYFLVNSLNASEKANLVKGCLLQMEETGIKIKSLTFDGCASNITMCNILGAKLDWPNIKPYFINSTNGEHVHIIVDPSHMIKLCRNTLGDWGFFYDENNGRISWEYLVKLVKIQNETGLHAATKVRNRHLDYNKEKMKVKLATQALSASTADAIEYCNVDLNIFDFVGSEPFVRFCRIMNNIFDVLNSRNFLSKEFYKQPLSLKSEQYLNDFIDSSINYLSKLKDKEGNLIIKSRRKTGFLGLIISLKSVGNLFVELVKNNTLKFLLTYKLSQDHIELLFSVFRARGGYNNNPTAKQFEGSFKRILLHTELVSPETANCLALDDTSILNVSSKLKPVNPLDSLVEDDEISIDPNEITDAFYSISNTLYLSDVIEYISGFIAKKLTLKINCDICCLSLRADHSASRLLNRKNRGGLFKPSKDVVKICTTGESFVKSLNITQFTTAKFVLLTLRRLKHNELFKDLDEHCYEQEPLSNHKYQLITLILNSYYTIRIHHINKTKNEVVHRIRHKLTKYIHFSHQ